jgi:hypothetical protein
MTAITERRVLLTHSADLPLARLSFLFDPLEVLIKAAGAVRPGLEYRPCMARWTQFVAFHLLNGIARKG